VLDRTTGNQASDALVRRDTERATIDTLPAAAERGQSGALVLTGPPGIGKSALVHYAREAAAPFRALRVEGVEAAWPRWRR
jgi:Cdc6-like AAA superfamily ATPase